MNENMQNRFPENAMYGHCYVMNQKLTNLYPLGEGFNKGTIFPELYSPYSPCDSYKELQYLSK